MKKIIIIIFIVMVSLCTFAQQRSTIINKGFVYFDLNGLCPGDKPTKAEVIKKFGKPLKYSVEQTRDVGGDNHTISVEIYEYKDCYFTISSDYGFDLFISTNPEIPAFTKDVKNGIKPGDSVDKILELGVFRWEKSTYTDDRSEKTGGDWYGFSTRKFSDDTTYILVKDGIVLGFEYSMGTC